MNNTVSAVGACVVLSFGLGLSAPVAAPSAHAQPVDASVQPGQPAEPEDPTAPDGADEDSDPAPTTREHAPNTDDCPHRVYPPQARTTSERVEPGETSPQPLPPIEDQDCGITAVDGFNVDESVLASAWLVADIDSGEIIATKDPHGRYRPASIIKVLLALVAIEELDLNATVEVSRESASQPGSAVGIGAGGHYTIEQLMYGLLLASGNDAAHALAEQLGGKEATLAKINKLAKELGTTDTYAASISGLDAAGMSSSAYDLGLMYRAAYANPTFERLVNTDFIEFPGYDDLPSYEVWNDNHLFLNDPDGIGGKTGYTDDANHTFVGALDHRGRRLMAIILDTTVDKARPWQQAQELLHAAYDTTAGDSPQAGKSIGKLTPISRQDTEPTLTEGATPQQQEDSDDSRRDGKAKAASESGGGIFPDLSDSDAWAGTLVVLGIVAAGAACAGIGGILLRNRRSSRRRSKR